MKKDFTSTFKNITNQKRDQEIESLIKLQSENKDVKEIDISLIKIKSNIRDENNVLNSLDLESISTTGQLVPVLLTSDNFIIDGYRRYNYLKQNNIGKIKVFYLDKTSKEISDNEFKEFQYYSNENRKNLDNFELSVFYSSYNLSNKELAIKFNKSEGYISEIKKLKEIDKKLVTLLREFQIYAYSKKKFDASKNLEEDKFYQKNKNTFIGIRSLYKIAVSSNQRKTFYQLFKNRLSDSELKQFSEFENEEKNKKEINGFDILKDFRKNLEELYSGDKLDAINEKLRELEDIIKN